MPAGFQKRSRYAPGIFEDIHLHDLVGFYGKWQINHTYMDPMGYAKYPKTPNSSGSYAHHVLQISYVYFFGFECICPPLSLCMYTAGYDAPEVGCHRASQLPSRWLPRGSSWRPTKALGVRNIVMVADPRLEAKKQRRHPESISAAVCLCGFVFPEI